MTGEESIKLLQDWLLEAGTKRSDRPWCLFGVEDPVDRLEVTNRFDRSDLFQQHAERYQEADPIRKKPHSFLQVECHLLYGIHKAFVARHKTRLQAYRDDASQKVYHTRRAIDRSYSRLRWLQTKADADAVGDS